MSTFKLVAPALPPPFDRARFTGREIVLAPYASAADWDQHFADTEGFGDPYGLSSGELRFGADDGLLKSLSLLVPQVSPVVFSNDLEITAADSRVLGSVPVYEWPQLFLSAEAGLMCFGPEEEEVIATAVQVAENLSLLVNEQAELCGWHLRHPASALTAGWEPCSSDVVHARLGEKLVDYLVMAHDEHFLDLLAANDEGARTRAQALKDSVANLGEETGQARVLHQLVDKLLDR